LVKTPQNLQGTVDEAAFLALCEGRNPMTGLKLGQRMNTVHQDTGKDWVANRRIFYACHSFAEHRYPATKQRPS
jgi:hypothetical protein